MRTWNYFSGGAKIWPPGDNYYHTYLLPMAPLAVSFNCDYREHVLDSHRIIGPQSEDRCDALVVAQITVAPQIRGLLSRSLTRRRIDQAEGASDNCTIRKLRYGIQHPRSWGCPLWQTTPKPAFRIGSCITLRLGGLQRIGR